jgi:hypothetical protein
MKNRRRHCRDRAGLLTSHPIDASADVAFQHVCRLGLEVIAPKRLGSRHESGRSSLWLKTMNPERAGIAAARERRLARMDRATTLPPTAVS